MQAGAFVHAQRDPSFVSDYVTRAYEGCLSSLAASQSNFLPPAYQSHRAESGYSGESNGTDYGRLTKEIFESQTTHQSRDFASPSAVVPPNSNSLGPNESAGYKTDTSHNGNAHKDIIGHPASTSLQAQHEVSQPEFLGDQPIIELDPLYGLSKQHYDSVHSSTSPNVTYGFRDSQQSGAHGYHTNFMIDPSSGVPEPVMHDFGSPSGIFHEYPQTCGYRSDIATSGCMIATPASHSAIELHSNVANATLIPPMTNNTAAEVFVAPFILDIDYLKPWHGDPIKGDVNASTILEIAWGLLQTNFAMILSKTIVDFHSELQRLVNIAHAVSATLSKYPETYREVVKFEDETKVKGIMQSASSHEDPQKTMRNEREGHFAMSSWNISCVWKT